MNYTKSALKGLIIEVAEEYSLDLGLEDAPSFFNESHGFPYPWERRSTQEAKEAQGRLKKFGDAEEEETEEDIQTFLEEAYAKLHEALDVASRLNPGLALEIGPIAHSVGELLDEEPEEEEYEEEEDIDIDIEDF